MNTNNIGFEKLIGKTIVQVITRRECEEHDDEVVDLVFKDGCKATLMPRYGLYTGEPSDECPMYLDIEFHSIAKLKTLNVVRVAYGKPDIPLQDREYYHHVGGPVGSVRELIHSVLNPLKYTKLVCFNKDMTEIDQTWEKSYNEIYDTDEWKIIAK